MRYQMIVSNEALAHYCAAAASATVLAVDTEFVRTNTLMPKLGLVQLNAGAGVALVDPLTITDWQPLIRIMQNPAIVKLIHSCTEDLEALASVGIRDIHSLFDTQLAVELLGWGSSVGYAKMVEQFTGKVLDKSESRTDWIARPLSETQLEYAANDVDYLLPLYPLIQAKLPNANSHTLLLAEGRSLVERRQRPLPDAFKYLELKNSWQFAGRDLALLRDLCAWRSSYAQQKDMALSLVLKDALMYEFARRKPVSIEAMLQIDGISARDVRRHGPLWLAMIKQSRQLAAGDVPQTFYETGEFPGFKVLQQQLQDAVNAAAKAAGIPAELLSVKRLLNEYLNWCWRVSASERAQLPLPEFLRPWRWQYLKGYLPVPQHVKALVDEASASN